MSILNEKNNNCINIHTQLLPNELNENFERLIIEFNLIKHDEIKKILYEIANKIKKFVYVRYYCAVARIYSQTNNSFWFNLFHKNSKDKIEYLLSQKTNIYFNKIEEKNGKISLIPINSIQNLTAEDSQNSEKIQDSYLFKKLLNQYNNLELTIIMKKNHIYIRIPSENARNVFDVNITRDLDFPVFLFEENNFFRMVFFLIMLRPAYIL